MRTNTSPESGTPVFVPCGRCGGRGTIDYGRVFLARQDENGVHEGWTLERELAGVGNTDNPDGTDNYPEAPEGWGLKPGAGPGGVDVMTSDSWPGRIELNPGSPATVTLVDGQGKDLGTFDSPEEAIASMPGAAPEAGPTAQSKAVRLSLTNGRALACGTHAGYGTLPTAHPATRRCQRCANTTPATTEEKPHVPDV